MGTTRPEASLADSCVPTWLDRPWPRRVARDSELDDRDAPAIEGGLWKGCSKGDAAVAGEVVLIVLTPIAAAGLVTRTCRSRRMPPDFPKGSRPMKNRLAAALALLLALPLSGQQPPKPAPPIDKPPLAPPTADASKEKEKEKPKWDVA